MPERKLSETNHLLLAPSDDHRYRGGADLKRRRQSTSTSQLRTTFGGIGFYQTRDQISVLFFLAPFVFSATARRLQVACEGPRYPRRSSRLPRMSELTGRSCSQSCVPSMSPNPTPGR